MLPTLKQGTQDSAVSLFKALCGYADTSSAFDAAFAEFIKNWQKENGLTPDGIIGQKTWAALLKKALGIESEKGGEWIEPLDFKQYDPRWANIPYSSHGDKTQTIRSSGCGPTAMADIVAAVKDETATPATLAEKALAWGDRTPSSGTAWRFFAHAAREYGFAYEQSGSFDRLQSHLSRGGWAVAGMGKGYWTKGGHYICVWKIEGNYVYAHDPASSKRTKQKIEDFKKEKKMFFLFSL